MNPKISMIYKSRFPLASPGLDMFQQDGQPLAFISFPFFGLASSCITCDYLIETNCVKLMFFFFYVS